VIAWSAGRSLLIAHSSWSSGSSTRPARFSGGWPTSPAVSIARVLKRQQPRRNGGAPLLALFEKGPVGETGDRRGVPGFLDYRGWPRCRLHSPRTERMRKNIGRLAQTFDLAGTTMQWVPHPSRTLRRVGAGGGPVRFDLDYSLFSGHESEAADRSVRSTPTNLPDAPPIHA
jgi:hypothetical protein